MYASEISQDIENTADHLVSTIVMLKEQDRWHELKPNSMLYTLLMKKIPDQCYLITFVWTSEHSREDMLVTLCDWMVDETEYRVVHKKVGKACQRVEPKEVL